MLLQSQGNEIHLLPALPTAWPDGRITGVCARGGIQVSLYWVAGKLVSASLRSTHVGTHSVRYGSEVIQVSLSPGRERKLYPNAFNPVQKAALGAKGQHEITSL